MTDCPDENELTELLATAESTRRAALERHLEVCEWCRLSALACAETLPGQARSEPVEGPIHEGRFELVRLIGRGGFSMVWEAKELTTGSAVALKIVEDELGAAAARRAVREARALSEMECPHILKAREAFRTVDGRVAIVTELLRGEDLGGSLQRSGARSEHDTRRIVREIALGLAYAHARGIVHRDLKPRNVFLEGPNEHVRILDFGMAKWLDVLGVSSKLTATGTILGTPAYMSPEQISGEAELGAASDVWSLGVLAIETMSGKSPIEGRSFGRIFRTVTSGRFPRLRESVAGASDALATLVDSMLQVERSERPSAADIARALA